MALSICSRASLSSSKSVLSSLRLVRCFSGVARSKSAAAERGIGIVGMEVYFPATYVSQESLEIFDGVSKGKYVVGLGQKGMAVANELEDINSICLTAVQSLLEKYNVSPAQIGRVEVGTETLLDKSKSVKSELMRLFSPSGNTDIEGCDTINACYGGTSAFFNACSWVSSPDWEYDGRYALVVAGDIAVYERGPARPTGGCGAVALLIGPNAPIQLEHGLRASHSESAYDFYKPRLNSEFPLVDGKLSNRCYLRAIDLCYQRFLKRVAIRDGEKAAAQGLNYFDHFAFHSPYNKLIQKSFGRLALYDYYNNPRAERNEVLERFRGAGEEGYENKELDKAVLELSKERYDRMVAPTTSLSREIGNTYTASLWASLVSLIANRGRDLSGRRIGMFSYGSGLCASMFSLKGSETEEAKRQLEAIRNNINLFDRLQRRTPVTPEEFTQMLDSRAEYYGTNLKPKAASDTNAIQRLIPGSFYLADIDQLYRKSYARA